MAGRPGVGPDSLPRGSSYGHKFKDADLVAIVMDSQWQPAAGVPVEFRVQSGWEKNITLSSHRPMTDKNVQARTTFQSNMTGVVHITAQAGDAATMAHIVVSASGSTPGGVWREQGGRAR